MNIKFKNILITGGAGFIGSNFVHYIYNKYPEYNIIVLDLLTYAGNLENLFDIEQNEKKYAAGEKKYCFIKGDICQPDLVDQILAEHKIDLVVNFAAESHVDRSIVGSKDFIRTNINGVHNLMDLARKYHIKRFVQISTDEVYGEVITGNSFEDSPLRPSNNYSVTKAAADMLVQSYVRVYKFPAIILRSSNNFGSYQYPEKLIPLVVTNLIEGKQVPVHGSGTQIRKWLHVNDFCEAIDLAIHQAEDSSIYNVAGIEQNNIEIIQSICNILGMDLRNACHHVNDRPGGDFRYSPDANKIKKELNWRPQYLINDTLPTVVDWYQKNQDWWKKIKAKEEFINHYNKQCQALYF